MARKKCICRNEKCDGEVLTVYIYSKDKETGQLKMQGYTDYCQNHIISDMQRGLIFSVKQI